MGADHFCEALIPGQVESQGCRACDARVTGAQGCLHPREGKGSAEVLGNATDVLAYAIAKSEMVGDAQVVGHVMHDVMHPTAVQAGQRACKRERTGT